MGGELRSIFAGHFGYACAECARVGDIDIVGDDVRALGQEVDEDAVLRVLDVVVVADALAVLDVAVGELIARELVGWLEACSAMVVDGHILHVAVGIDGEHHLKLVANVKLIELHHFVAIIFPYFFLDFDFWQTESLCL